MSKENDAFKRFLDSSSFAARAWGNAMLALGAFRVAAWASGIGDALHAAALYAVIPRAAVFAGIPREIGRHEGFATAAPAAFVHKAIVDTIILSRQKHALPCTRVYFVVIGIVGTCAIPVAGLVEVQRIIDTGAIAALCVHRARVFTTCASLGFCAIKSPRRPVLLIAFSIAQFKHAGIVFGIRGNRSTVTGFSGGMRQDV